MLDILTHYFKLIVYYFCVSSIITTQMQKLCTVLAGIYVFQVNNRNTRKGEKYVNDKEKK